MCLLNVKSWLILQNLFEAKIHCFIIHRRFRASARKQQKTTPNQAPDLFVQILPTDKNYLERNEMGDCCSAQQNKKHIADAPVVVTLHTDFRALHSIPKGTPVRWTGDSPTLLHFENAFRFNQLTIHRSEHRLLVIVEFLLHTINFVKILLVSH